MTEDAAPPLQIRLLGAADIPFGMRLKEEAGWNQTEADWELFLRLRPEGSFLATWDGAPAGTVTTIDYGGAFGWIAMVLVSARLRRRGIGTALVERAIESFPPGEPVKLDATPAGRAVYERLGFAVRCPLARWRREPGPVPARSRARERAGVRPARRGDAEAIARFDAPVFGASRAPLLDDLRARAAHSAFIAGDRGRLTGFSLGRDGSRHAHIGPVVAETEAGAMALLRAAVAAARERSTIIDAFPRSRAWTALLADLGFRRERELVRMVRGDDDSPGRPGLQWAAAGPELG